MALLTGTAAAATGSPDTKRRGVLRKQLSFETDELTPTARACTAGKVRARYLHCVPKKVSPLNILQQPPQTGTDLNEILHTQDDIYFCRRRQIS